MNRVGVSIVPKFSENMLPLLSKEEEQIREIIIDFSNKLLSFMRGGCWFKVLFLMSHQTRQDLLSKTKNSPSKEIVVAFGVEGWRANTPDFSEERFRVFDWNNSFERRALKCLLLFRAAAHLNFREFSFCEEDYSALVRGDLSFLGALKKDDVWCGNLLEAFLHDEGYNPEVEEVFSVKTIFNNMELQDCLATFQKEKQLLLGGESVLPKFSENDLVESPSHYVEGREIDPIRVIEDWSLPHHLACALKYICRAGRKGDEVLDLEKAIWYLQRRKALLESRKEVS